MSTQELKGGFSNSLLLFAGAVYLAWWGVVRCLLPHAFNPLGSRLAVVGLFLAMYAWTRGWVRARERSALLFMAGAWCLTLHYFYLLWGNHGASDWAVGTYFTVVPINAFLPTRRSLLAYGAWVLTLGLAAAALVPPLRGSLFLPGLFTITALAYVGQHQRLMIAEERTRRLVAEAEREIAEQAMRRREEFTSIAAHELGTPLTALLLHLQTLRQSVEGKPHGETMRKHLASCERQVRRLSRLSRDLIELSRLDLGRFRLELQEVDLGALTREVSHGMSYEINASRSEVTVDVRGDTSLRADGFRLEQVVSNLLRNALLYGEGKPISIRVEGKPTEVELSVADLGMGIAPEHQTRVFERFERAVSTAHYGGLGLGLYLAKSIVESHRGTIQTRSAPGQGTTMTVRLPRHVG